MTDPVLLLNSTVLVAYERDLTRRAQAVGLEALADGRLMVTAALSLPVTCTELGGETRELAWLIYDRDGPLSVPPLALGAMEVGTTANGAKTAGELEVAQVIHEAHAASAIVFTYDPDRCTGHRIDVVDLRP